jgi:lipopolysaccharide biosynthesis glycosyltransferase
MKYLRLISLLVSILLTIFPAHSQSDADKKKELSSNEHNSTKHLQDVVEQMQQHIKALNYYYSRSYSSFRKSHLEFDLITSNLQNKDSLIYREKEALEKLCLFQIEEGIDRIYISKGYDCLSRLQARREDLAEEMRSIKNSSYALDIFYTKDYAQNLAETIVGEHKIGVNKEDLGKYFTGRSEDEIPFLVKLVELKIPSLSAKARYRLSMIYLLGRSSYLEPSTPNLEKAVVELNSAIQLSSIKAKNVTNIAITINDQYAPHAAATLASALLNADLDSFYNFNFVMNVDDPISEDSKKKLGSMQNIRNYTINFIPVDSKMIPTDLIKNKFHTYEKFSYMVVYRLFFDKILSKLDRVLYIDADLLVLRDLNYFNKIDMNNYFIAATYDWGVANVSRVGCNKDFPNQYINAGVIFFDLKNIRNHSAGDLLINAMLSTKCDLYFFDQDLLNIAFEDRINYISHRWNYTRNMGNKVISNYYTKFILHYAAKPKPWDKSLNELNDLDREYWRYRALTPYSLPK